MRRGAGLRRIGPRYASGCSAVCWWRRGGEAMRNHEIPLALVELDVLGAVSVWGLLRLRVDDGRMR